jgi:signal transduction histidine kinase
MRYNLEMLRRLKFGLMDLAGLFTVSAVAIISFVSIDDPAMRWAAVGLCLAFAALLVYHPHGASEAMLHGYLAAQTLLAVGLLLAKPNAFAAPILFFILSAEVMVTLPTARGLAWIAGFLVLTFVNAAIQTDWLNALLYALPYAGGFLFFGTFGKALRDTQLARLESQRLLAELQAAQEQLKELAVAEERDRLAREMHDSLGHRLTVAVVQLEGAQRLIPKDPERAARMIGSMREQMKEALADLRRTVAALRTPAADDLPFDAALQRLVQSFEESTGLSVQLSLAPLPALSEAQELALYRAAQEALTNAQRHAGARRLWLEVRPASDRVVLTAADDGQGYPPELDGGGFGLRGLRERAVQLGGDLALEARPGGGAQLRFWLPAGPYPPTLTDQPAPPA